jgi:hypothetical protein
MTAGPAPGAGYDPPPRSEPSHPTAGQSGPGRSDPLASSGDAGAWWEGDWRPDDDELEDAEWADPPGQPLDEEAIQAARAASISAEVLGTGFWRRVGTGPGVRTIIWSRSGLGSGDELDELEPGPALAGLTDTVTRPDRIAGLDDDELIGTLRAWRRLESWTAAGTLMVVAELARRRPAHGSAPAAAGRFPDRPSEFLTDEIAAALTLTGPAADTCLDLALDLAIRLPGTARALRAGIIDYLRARIIAEATRVLSEQDARRVEDQILAKAGQQTSGQLRAALARTILAIDPEAAQRRREQAQKDPRVRRWREDAGTAALAGYGLPPADVLEANQHLTDRALDLRAAGVAGTLDELRARAYLDALLGRDSALAPPGTAAEPGEPAETAGPGAAEEPSPSSAPPAAPSEPAPSEPAPSEPAPSEPAPSEPAPSGPPAHDAPSTPDAPFTGAAPSGSSSPSVPAGPAPTSASSTADAPPADAAPCGPPADAASTGGEPPAAPAPAGGRLAARINVTVPLLTLLGLSGGPGEIGGFGPIDAALARDITRRAATHPHTSWTLTITHTGQAVAHGPIPARRARRFFAHPSGPEGRAGPPNGGPHDGGPPGRAGPSGQPPGPGGLTVTITPLARDSCDHRNEESRYQPGRRLQNLVMARTATCTAPGCRRPAARCDLDHTVAYDQGGRTCECNLAPLCRHHHRCKQADGWHLEQITPGVMRWITPAGRTYVTTPTTYH